MIENTSDLAGKVALVTGGNRGIERSIALALAEAGADIALSYRGRENEALQVRSELESSGHRCVVVQADVSVVTDVSRMIELIRGSLGGVGNGVRALSWFGCAQRTEKKNIGTQGLGEYHRLRENKKGVPQRQGTHARAFFWGNVTQLSRHSAREWRNPVTGR